MAVTPDRPGPYAPLSTILDVIGRYRDRGLPTPISKEVLARAGIAETLIPRVIQSLTTLDLVDEAGQPTPVFEGMRRAPQNEYQQRVKEWLDATYADVLHYVDPATATEVEVRDAFRNYNPVGQQPRMVSLFIGLYGHAGVGAEPQPRTTTRRAAPPRPRQPAPKPETGARDRKGHVVPPANGMPSGLPPALAGLMASIPLKGWTQDMRDRFMATFESVLDYSVPIKSAAEVDAEEENEAA